MELESWKSQLRKGAAELAVLALLGKRDLSGIGLLDELSVGAYIGLSDGSIYPLLNRLEREGKLASRWDMDGETRHPRKYYALTPQGRKLFAQMREAWGEFDGAMNAIMEKSR